MRIVDGGSPAPTFWSFVFGHDNLKPSIAAKALIGGHCLKLVRHKDGSIVSISRISEVSVQLFILDAVKPAVIQVLNERMRHFKGSKHTRTIPTHF